MRRITLIALLAAMMLPGMGFAAGSVAVPYHMEPDLDDAPSLQRGFRLYMDYCMGCHSLQYQRYERTADDLQIPHEVVVENVIFTGQNIGGLMQNSVPAASKNWFGAPPPDLTMISRVRGSDWLYSYLKTFYRDPSRPLGANNVVFKDVGMPHVLEELQGVQTMGCEMVPELTEEGHERRDPLVPGKKILHEECGRLVVEEGTGLMSAEEYDQAVFDIVNFLYYVGDPSRAERYRLGVFVLLFLVVLYAFTYLLARDYKKEIH